MLLKLSVTNLIAIRVVAIEVDIIETDKSLRASIPTCTRQPIGIATHAEDNLTVENVGIIHCQKLFCFYDFPRYPMNVFSTPHVIAAAVRKDNNERAFCLFQRTPRSGLGILVTDGKTVKVITEQLTQPVPNGIQKFQIIGLRVQTNRLV